MFGLSHLQVDSILSYLLAFILPCFDAVLPILPSETVIVALGVATAGSHDPRIALLVALAALGACAGDNICYVIGNRFEPWVNRRFFSDEKGRERRAWADEKLQRYGVRLIVVCRFIPGGRTAVTLTCGVTGYPHRRFFFATLFAGVIWASYAFFLGRLGGSAFENRPWIGLILSLGAVFVVTGLVEVGRRMPRWWRRYRARSGGAPRRAGDGPEPDAGFSEGGRPER